MTTEISKVPPLGNGEISFTNQEATSDPKSTINTMLLSNEVSALKSLKGEPEVNSTSVKSNLKYPPLPSIQGNTTPVAQSNDIDGRKVTQKTVPTPNRVERRTMFGIDCAETVHFTHWEPGGEHDKILIIKNVVMKTQKIRYKLPQTKYFSMEFPVTVTLSAGMSWTVPITFRPVAKEVYQDVIEFTTSFGKFNVPILATLPIHYLSFTPEIDFQYCPIREVARKTFIIKNTGQLTSEFEWECESPFRVIPSKGELAVNKEIKMTIEFKPMDAYVFALNSIIHFGDFKNPESIVKKSLKVNGIGKFSYLCIENNPEGKFEFEDVIVGKAKEISFVLLNSSVVEANFRIRSSEKVPDPYFIFSETSGTVPGNGRLNIKVIYKPVAANMYSSEYFNIITQSGNIVRITCTGRGVGPSVILSADSLNFNDVELGNTAMRAVSIQNESSATVFYQFQCEKDAVFQFDKYCGTLNPFSVAAIAVKFWPIEPMNYHRRVYLLAENQDAQYIDLLGTCYDGKRRPASFNYIHLEKYWLRVKRGLWQYAPEQLEEMLKNSIIKLLPDKSLDFSDPKYYHKEEVEKLLEDFEHSDSPIAHEYFHEHEKRSALITLLDPYVDFGSCSRFKMIDSRIVRVRNNTIGKLTCVWVIPREQTSSVDDLKFVVSPRSCDILPKSIMEFRVSFRPDMENAFYGTQLECYVYFKSMRSFRLVNEDTFGPPYCTTLMVSGNTFTPGEDAVISKITVHAHSLDFPSCFIGHCKYRAVRITNTGDTAVKYNFVDSIGTETARIFSVKPRFCLLDPNQDKLIVLKFSPREEKVFDSTIKCVFNNLMNDSYDLQLRGIGHRPNISFNPNDGIWFRPTCIGAVSERTFELRNQSKIFVFFKWRNPKQFSHVIFIYPDSGMLYPNGTMKLHCTFAPTHETKMCMKIPCFYSHDRRLLETEDYNNQYVKRETLLVIGRGVYGQLKCDSQTIDFNDVLIDTTTEQDITIYNPSDCDVFYTLEIYRSKGEIQNSKRKSIHQHHSTVGNEYEKVQLAFEEQSPLNQIQIQLENNLQVSQIQISDSQNILSARSHRTIRTKICLKHQQRCHFLIYYRLKNIRQQFCPSCLYSETDIKTQTQRPSMKRVFADLNTHVELEKHPLCTITCQGVYPLLQITDIRCEGIPKSVLWKYFQIEKFNEIINQPVKKENFHNSETETNRMITFFNRDMMHGSTISSMMHFDFGSMPEGSDVTTVFVNFKNTGVVPVDWVFIFPNDLEVDVEHWADPGEYSQEQHDQNKVLDHKLFTVEPKNGHMLPGESQKVVMTYSHLFSGFYKLPIIFKIVNAPTPPGKHIYMTFLGFTIASGKKHLHFHSTEHVFQPVPIGEATPPLQNFSFINGGPTPLEFFLDLKTLQSVQEANFGYPVFTCKQSSGMLIPGEVASLDWIFHPLEERLYEVDVPITIRGYKSTFIKFKGLGVLGIDKDEIPTYLKEPTSIPAVQHLPIPGQLACLSIERINFGHLPINSCQSRLVVVRNTSPYRVGFKWNNFNHIKEELIQIQPLKGILNVNESRVCKITLIPAEEPRVYELDIICEVVNQDELELFEKKMAEKEKMRQEFQVSMFGQQNDKEKREQDILGCSLRQGNKIELKTLKYPTLPPINGQIITEESPKNGSEVGPNSNEILEDHNQEQIAEEGSLEDELDKVLSISSSNTSNSTGQKKKKVDSYENEGNRGKVSLTRKMSASSVVTDLAMVNVELDPPPWFTLYCTVLCRTYFVNEFECEFPGYYGHFAQKRLCSKMDGDYYNEYWRYIITEDERDLEATMMTLLDEIIQETSLKSLRQEFMQAKAPFFLQIGNHTTNKWDTENEVEKTEKAAKNNSLPNVASPSEEDKQSPSQEKSDNEKEEENGETLADVVLKNIPHLVDVDDLESNAKKYLGIPEFQQLSELILSHTLCNLMQEANCFAFDISKKPSFLQLPPKKEKSPKVIEKDT